MAATAACGRAMAAAAAARPATLLTVKQANGGGFSRKTFHDALSGTIWTRLILMRFTCTKLVEVMFEIQR